MKLTPVLLTLSLLANAALVAVVVLRSPVATAPAGSVASSASTRAGGSEKSPDALRAALASGDVAALEAAGMPADVARQIVLGRALTRYHEKLQSLRSADGKWWRNRADNPATREQRAQARREMSEAMAAVYGVDIFSNENESSQLAFLPQAKRDALWRITQDYDEMMAKFSASGIQLPSDREKLKLLRAERDRDIAALLTPAEFADYEMRTSASAANVRARYGDAIESEDEFRKLFALQKAFDEKFPREAFTGRIAPEQMQARQAAERQLQDDMRAALGDERFAELRRASDFDLRNVESLASRLNLPADTTARVAGTRDTYSTESQRISADTSLTPQQRREKIQELGTRAKNDLARTLGTEAADAYGQRSPWVSMLQGGMAFSTNPKDAPGGAVAAMGQSVFPVLPAGAVGPGGGAVRQVVNFVGADPTAGGGGAPLFFNADAPVRMENRQVISVVTAGGQPGDTATVRITPPATPPPASTAPAPRP